VVLLIPVLESWLGVARRVPVDLAIALGQFDLGQAATVAGAHQALAGQRVVDGAVDAAHDEALVAVEELAFLPVHLGGHMGAAVQVGHHLAVEAQRERANRLAPLDDVEADGLAALLQFGRGAQALRRRDDGFKHVGSASRGVHAWNARQRAA
jgi:hypothetical protein